MGICVDISRSSRIMDGVEEELAYSWGNNKNIVGWEKVGKEIKLIRNLLHTYTHTHTHSMVLIYPGSSSGNSLR